MNNIEAELFRKIQIFTDTPYPGATYYDLRPLLANSKLMIRIIEKISSFIDPNIDLVMAPETSGIAFGAAVAAINGKGFVALSKYSRLYTETVTINVHLPHRRHPETSYCFQSDGIEGKRVLLVDDIIYSGHTVLALVEGLRTAGVEVDCISCVLGFPNMYRKVIGEKICCVIQA